MASPCLRDREIEVGWGGDGERKFKSRVVEYGEAATVAAAFLIRGLPGNSNSSSVCHQGQLLSKHSGKLRVCWERGGRAANKCKGGTTRSRHARRHLWASAKVAQKKRTTRFYFKTTTAPENNQASESRRVIVLKLTYTRGYALQVESRERDWKP